MTYQEATHDALSSLTGEQQAKVRELQQAVSGELQANAPLRLWCTSSTVARHLQARNWHVANADKQLRGTLEWRKSYRPDLIKWADIEPEAVTGKQFRLHVRDKQGRAVLVMRPRNENTKGAERQLKYVIYCLEIGCRAADEAGVGKITWLIDFEGYSYKNAPPISLALKTLSILQNHYPERLGLACCYHPPKIFQLTWKAVRPFIDPVTHKKIVFVDTSDKQTMSELFYLDHLEQCMGGNLPSEQVFNLDKYRAEMLREDAEQDQKLQQVQASSSQSS